MWYLVNHTRRHIVRTDLSDIGRQMLALTTYSGWNLLDHIDAEEVDISNSMYRDYTFDL